MSNSMRSLRRTPKGVPGQAIVIVALGMIGLLAFLVLAIDGSRYYDQRRTAQNAADAASLAGMYANYHDSNPTYDDVIIKVNTAAEANSIPDTDGNGGNDVNANVTAYWINSSGDYVSNTSKSGCTGKTVTSGSGKVEPPDSCAQIDTSTSLYAPSGTSGIKVRTVIAYTAFVAHIIGQKNLQVQADGTSMAALSGDSTNAPTQCNGPCALTAGGNICTTDTNAALYWGGGNGNNLDMGKGFFANGYLQFNGMPNTINQEHHTGQQGAIVSINTPQTKYDSGGNNYQWPSGEVPIASGDSANWTTQPYNFYGAGSSLAVQTQPFYPWGWLKAGQLYMLGATKIPPSTQQIQAYFYKPYQEDIKNGDIVDTPANAYYGGAYHTDPTSTAQGVPTGSTSTTPNWIFKGTELNINNGVPVTKAPHTLMFHYINDTSAAKNADDLATMVGNNERGIFFIDGDLDTLNATGPGYKFAWPDGVAVVVTGRAELKLGDGTYGKGDQWARGMTLLAGGTYTGYTGTLSSPTTKTLSRAGVKPSNADLSCANDNSLIYNIVHIDGQQTYWNGIMYVPNGNFFVEVNQHNGGNPFNGPVFSWSFALNLNSHPANNYHFSTCDASCYPDPSYVLGLQQ